MTTLDKLIELNNLEKENRKIRLEDKLRQQEYYDEIKELFFPLPKTLNTNSETKQGLQNKISAALDSNTNALKSLGHQQQNSFLDERAALLTPTPDPLVKLKDGRGKTFTVDNDMIDILLLMGKQTNKQTESILVDPNSNKIKINGIDISLVSDGTKLKVKAYDFSKGFLMFITSKNVTQRDLKADENKIKQFLKDICYKQKRDTKSNRSKPIRRMLASIGEPTSQVISRPTSSEDEICRRDTSYYEQGGVGEEEEEEEEEEKTDYETDKQIEASGLGKGDPNNLIESLELPILETKAGHDELSNMINC